MAQAKVNAASGEASAPAENEPATVKDESVNMNAVAAAESLAAQQAAARTSAQTLAETGAAESGNTLDSSEWLVQMNMEVTKAVPDGAHTEIPPGLEIPQGEVEALAGSPPGQQAPPAMTTLPQTQEPARLAEAQTKEDWIAPAWGVQSEEQNETGGVQNAAQNSAPAASSAAEEILPQVDLVSEYEMHPSSRAEASAEHHTETPAAFERLMRDLASAQNAEQKNPQPDQGSMQKNASGRSDGAPADPMSNGARNASALFSEVKIVQNDGQPAVKVQTPSSDGANQAAQSGAAKNGASHPAQQPFTVEVVDMQSGTHTGLNGMQTGAKSTPAGTAAAAFSANAEETAPVVHTAAAGARPTESEHVESSAPMGAEKSVNFVSPSAAQAVEHAERAAETHTTQRILSQTIAKMEEMTTTGQKMLRMQLHPENLGALELRFTSQNGSVQVTILAESSTTQQALQRHAADLQQALIHSGVSLSGLSVGQRDAAQQNTAGDSHSTRNNPSRLAAETSDDETLETAEAVVGATVYHNPYSSLDYRV